MRLNGGRAGGSPAASARRPLAALATVCVLLSIYAACPALAAAPDTRFQPNLDATVRYLQLRQNEDGGFGGEPGAKSESDPSAWVALALAAAGINPRDQTTANQHYKGGNSVFSYLTEHAGSLSLTTDFERELLVVDATGSSPYDFGGVNLVERLLRRQMPQFAPDGGAFAHEAGSTKAGMNDTIFAILALSPVHEPAAEHAVQIAAEWVEEEQDCDYGWPATAPRIAGKCATPGHESAGEPESEVDMTGAAIEALNAAGHHNTITQANAFKYLKDAQRHNGGFPEEPGDPEPEPNVASTAWVVQAMWSAGINPETWCTHSVGLASEEPLGYLASMQQEGGHIRYEDSLEENGVWMTAYVTPAFAGDPLPIPAPPYEELPPAPPGGSAGGSPTSLAGSGDGEGGESLKAGKGVIVGGGGPGAPLFSRPQPHSQGHTPGGVRLLSKEHAKEPHTHQRNPGRPRKTPTPTLTTQTNVRRSVLTAGDGEGGRGTGEPVVKGILIGDASNAGYDSTLEPGAPGLHSSGAGGNETQWPAIAVGGLIALLILAGSQLERRRPQVTL
jgi:Squalene-hopene cyclase C-terminal domain/Prenyltransferase and squalene oxidase repeat